MALSVAKKIIISLLLLLLLNKNLFAQSTATAIVSATVTDAVGTIQPTDINFDRLPVDKKAATIGFNSGSIIPVTSFTIVGSNYMHALTLPSTVILKRKNSNENMEAKLFYVSSEKISDPFSQTLYLKASVKVTSSQRLGDYISITPLPVTVNYN